MNQLEQVKKALDEAIAQKKLSQEMLKNLGPAIIETLQPVLMEIARNAKISKEELVDAISQIEIQVPAINVPHATVDVKIPEIKFPSFPEIRIPEIKIPDIIVPESKVIVDIPEIKLPAFPKIKIPNLKWPEEEMPIKGWVSLMGVDMNNPLPVQLRDAKGNPVNLFNNIVQGGSGGGINPRFFKDIENKLTNAVSTLNSSETPLGISGVFTGKAEDITQFAAITVSAYSNRASATDGLSIQFSSDGNNWDHTETHTISAASSHVTSNAPQGKYFRVVYTNGVLAQTDFRLQVIFSTESVGPIIEELGGDVSDRTSAITTKAVLFAKSPAGIYGAIDRTTGGNLKVSVEEMTVSGSTGTTTAVSIGADASTNIIPTQSSRKSISLVHTSSSNLYISTGSAASTTSMPVVANQVVVFDDYTGPLNAIAEEQAGTISVRYIEIV